MPAPIAALGSFAEPVGKLRSMLANCASWQAGCHASGPAEALESIYLRNAVGTERRPLAVITPGFAHRYTLIAGGAQNYLRPAGSVYLYLARDTDPPYLEDLVEAEIAAANFFGQVIDDLILQAGEDDKLAIVSVDLIAFDESPEETWQSPSGRFWFAAYSIGWGDA